MAMQLPHTFKPPVASFLAENIHTRIFTPQEYQVELLKAAKDENIIICLGSGRSKFFVSVMLIREMAYQLRRPRKRKKTIILSRESCLLEQSSFLQRLTDLKVQHYSSNDTENPDWSIEKWKNEIEDKQVLITTSITLLYLLKNEILCLTSICLLIVDDCHEAVNDQHTRQIMRYVDLYDVKSQPKILGLIAPVLNSTCDHSRLEDQMNKMEKVFHCRAETASVVVSILRYCHIPQELLVECKSLPSASELEERILEIVNPTLTFIENHRHDPSEIYAGEEYEEIISVIPDPKEEPNRIFNDFLYTLETLGPWCADRAALLLIIQIEKMKIRTPYERHFLLLSMVSTTLVKVRAVCDEVLQQQNDKDRIYQYAKPKILRLLEILRQYKTEPTIKSIITTPLIESEDRKDSKTPEEPDKEVENNDNAAENVVDNIKEDAVLIVKIDKKTTESENTDIPYLSSNNSTKLINIQNGTCIKDTDAPEKPPTLQNGYGTNHDNSKKAAPLQNGYVIENNENSEILVSFRNDVTGADRPMINGIITDTNTLDNMKMMKANQISDLNNDESHKVMIQNCDNLNGNYNDISEDVQRDEIFLTNDDNEKETNYKAVICNCDNHEKPDFEAAICNVSNDEKPDFEAAICNVSNDEKPDSGDNDDEPTCKPVGVIMSFQTQPPARPTGFFRRRDIPRSYFNPDDPDALCGIVFVQKDFTAKILYHLLKDLSRCDPDFAFLSPQYTMHLRTDVAADSREAEIEHRKQEEVLRRFRMRDCNLLVATSVLEEGIDIPKCNLVVRFDIPTTYQSYVLSKGRARTQDATLCILVEPIQTHPFIKNMAEYHAIEQLLLKKCRHQECAIDEEKEADQYDHLIQPFCPLQQEGKPAVTMATAVALVNKYCAKLPSDTFTRLSPIWTIKQVPVASLTMYQCVLQLPINSPVKQLVQGFPMPTKVLSKRSTALEMCKVLYSAIELDDYLLPVGKEGVQCEEDYLSDGTVLQNEIVGENEPRPGTTKRRQYYYKRISVALSNCRPVADVPVYLYHINMILTCPLPEEQNTRGRKICAPEATAQGFGILTLKEIPKICQFPIFTRSGEVRIDLQLSADNIVLTSAQLDKVVVFLNYTFSNVLRLEKYLMSFDPESSEHSYFIVPTIKKSDAPAVVDWEFLDVIDSCHDDRPRPIPDESRKDFQCDLERYQDAVVMPWYRNQDQPQYFYVAEICSSLSPKSTFPGSEYKTFEEYYFKKYNIQIQDTTQPLLDVDHTSARLNFLTPRYVNRKGVALPTSSEQTKRAKRENLEQKQILVPELCMLHPFTASLWRKAVSLPCIWYRINALLLANEIRVQVALSISLGMEFVPKEFNWPILDFGWTLSEVLKKARENANNVKEDAAYNDNIVPLNSTLKITEITDDAEDDDDEGNDPGKPQSEKTINEILHEEEQKLKKVGKRVPDTFTEIGTWSNDMAFSATNSEFEVDLFDPHVALPDNLTMINTGFNREIEEMNSSDWGTGIKERREMVRYGSPSSFYCLKNNYNTRRCGGKSVFVAPDDMDSDSDFDYVDGSDNDDDIESNSGIKIEFKGDNVAEAIEDESLMENKVKQLLQQQQFWDDPSTWEWDGEIDEHTNICVESFKSQVDEHCQRIIDQGLFITSNVDLKLKKSTNKIVNKAPLANYYDPNQTKKTVPHNSVRVVLRHIKVTPHVVLSTDFSFDSQPDLENHPGPSPSILLQGLTMSNANDGINLERLETIGDSFLKYAITSYLFCMYQNIHEGKLSHLRSKQVSNFNLYRLGRRKGLGEFMMATKFEPHDNWLPPCYYVPKELEQALIESGVPASHWNVADLPSLKGLTSREICDIVREKGERLKISCETIPMQNLTQKNIEELPRFIPYNLITQHSLPDKSIADCVEALIGSYLISCGPRGALIFMSWLGLRVLPRHQEYNSDIKTVTFGSLTPPESPLLHHIPDAKTQLEHLLDGYDRFEEEIGYYFNDRSYLLQAFTHASYHLNRLTDCYQRLEFLGDAILDYLITRHLYEDSRQHSPGALTDLRSALVNNTIFASLAVRYGFHKYFRHLSPGLMEVMSRFVRIQEENGHKISGEYYLIEEDECEEVEDVEVPKALGDVFESVAGAVFLDSGMSLDAVWKVYYQMMKKEIEQFSTNVPKSPIRELLELEPETAKFGKPEKLADGRRVRVTVEVFGKGIYKGIGRNYRIAKCTAAKCALKQLKKKGLLAKKN